MKRFEERADELREEVPDAIETLQDGLFGATALRAVPDTYHRWHRQPTCLSDSSRRANAEKNRFGFFPTRTQHGV